jgi:hypothetical protein
MDMQNVVTTVISCATAICFNLRVPFKMAVSHPLMAEKAIIGDNKINANV